MNREELKKLIKECLNEDRTFQKEYIYQVELIVHTNDSVNDITRSLQSYLNDEGSQMKVIGKIKSVKQTK